MIINNISIRKAKRTDLSDVFLWRNDRYSRDNFFNQEPIEFTSHAKWYQRALVDPDMFLFIGLLESKKIGVCRFDVKEENTSAEISINLNPIFRGKKSVKIIFRKIN